MFVIRSAMIGDKPMYWRGGPTNYLQWTTKAATARYYATKRAADQGRQRVLMFHPDLSSDLLIVEETKI